MNIYELKAKKYNECIRIITNLKKIKKLYSIAEELWFNFWNLSSFINWRTEANFTTINNLLNKLNKMEKEYLTEKLSLIDLLNNSPSVWFDKEFFIDILEDMNDEQKIKLREILLNEKDKLNKIEEEYKQAILNLNK